jgi:hypothetical protein
MEAQSQDFWKKCSSCKKPIALRATYYLCSVSTCNSPRTGYAFCSIGCFERHLPGARHRDAAAIEKTAPAVPHTDEVSAPVASAPSRIFVRPGSTTSTPAFNLNTPASNEVLVIASRLKDYIAARSEYSTSGSVMDVLSEHLRILCDRAIDNARADGRKTVMDRDFGFLKNLK